MKSVKILNLALAIALLVAGCIQGKSGLVEPTPQITCPVMREHIINCGINKKVYADYKGKRLNFCYKDCVEEFWKDPEKYIKILEDEGVTLGRAPGSDD